MRLLLGRLAACALSQTARAGIQDRKTITVPTLRLTGYDKINPPIATYPIPLPKASRPIPSTRSDSSAMWTRQLTMTR